MNGLISAINAINNHPILTFVIVLLIGCVWIYSRIPNIKNATMPKNGIISKKDDWVDAKKHSDKLSFILFIVGISITCGMSFYTPSKEEDFVLIFLATMATICFITIAGLQLRDALAFRMNINQPEKNSE